MKKLTTGALAKAASPKRRGQVLPMTALKKERLARLILELSEVEFGLDRVDLVRPLVKPKEPRSFKFDPDVYTALKLRAERENRSVNSLAEHLIWQEVKTEMN